MSCAYLAAACLVRYRALFWLCAFCRIAMKRPGSAEGGGMLASLGGGNKSTGGPAVLKPLAPPPSYTPAQVSLHSP